MSRAPVYISRLVVVTAALGAAGLLQSAWADEPSLGAANAVDPGVLKEQRAGTLTISDNIGEFLVAQSNQTLSQSSSNPALNAQTANSGDIFLGDEALSHARGMINVSMNSGHNALIQSVMSLTVVMTEAP